MGIPSSILPSPFFLNYYIMVVVNKGQTIQKGDVSTILWWAMTQTNWRNWRAKQKEDYLSWILEASNGSHWVIIQGISKFSHCLLVQEVVENGLVWMERIIHQSKYSPKKLHCWSSTLSFINPFRDSVSCLGKFLGAEVQVHCTSFQVWLKSHVFRLINFIIH